MKKTWQLINEVINLKTKKTVLLLTFRSGDTMITDPTAIANGFCKYFTEIGPSLARAIPFIHSSFHGYLGPAVRETVFLKPVTVTELKNTCMSFKNGKAPGYDHIPMFVIKRSLDWISESLTHLINTSLEMGIFPDKLKLAKIIPIFKTGDADTFTNYRPISILSSFSKIYERVPYNRLAEFIDKFEILHKFQFGFHSNHSTNFALTYLINKIATAIDRKEMTGGVFLDLSKAFDTLNHILSSKLERYGIRGMALKSIKSYFKDRKEIVQFNNVSSVHNFIHCGVPQGSILGPLFFILYVNYLPNASQLAQPLLFSDDTSICYSHSDPEVVATVLNEVIPNIDVWMKANKLSINVDKTYVIFQLKQKKRTQDFSLSIDDKLITRKQQVKFLGVLLDKNLSWKPHINHICKKTESL